MIFAVGRGMLEIGFRPIFSYRSDCLTIAHYRPIFN